MSHYMKKLINLPIPVIRTLHKLGSDISDARRRRRIPIALMAERAGISRATIARIEKGDPGTSISAYLAVLFCLGMIDRVNDLVDARHDLTGRELADERLPKRIRLPNKYKQRYEDD